MFASYHHSHRRTFQSTLRCKVCSATSSRDESFSSLSVPLPAASKRIIVRAFRGARQTARTVTYHTDYRLVLDRGDTVRHLNSKLAECIKKDPDMHLARPDLPWALFEVVNYTNIQTAASIKLLEADTPASSLGTAMQYAFQLPDATKVLFLRMCHQFHTCKIFLFFMS